MALSSLFLLFCLFVFFHALVVVVKPFFLVVVTLFSADVLTLLRSREPGFFFSFVFIVYFITENRKAFDFLVKKKPKNNCIVMTRLECLHIII